MDSVGATIKTDSGVYIGDICYALDRETYDKVWGDKYHYEDGCFETEDGWEFAVAGTAYGDGYYCDDWGNNYPIDAGVIGIVPLELCNREGYERGGTIILGAGEYGFYAENGCFEINPAENSQFANKEKKLHPIFDKIVIETGDEEDEDEEY